MNRLLGYKKYIILHLQDSFSFVELKKLCAYSTLLFF